MNNLLIHSCTYEAPATSDRDGNKTYSEPVELQRVRVVMELATVRNNEGYVAVTENAAYSGKKPEGKISVAGSSSVSPVMEKLAEAYQKVNTNAKVEI